VSKTGTIYVTGSTVTLDDATDTTQTNMLIASFDSTTLTASYMKGWGGVEGNEVGLDIKLTGDGGYLFVVGYSNHFK